MWISTSMYVSSVCKDMGKNPPPISQSSYQVTLCIGERKLVIGGEKINKGGMKETHLAAVMKKCFARSKKPRSLPSNAVFRSKKYMPKQLPELKNKGKEKKAYI